MLVDDTWDCIEVGPANHPGAATLSACVCVDSRAWPVGGEMAPSFFVLKTQCVGQACWLCDPPLPEDVHMFLNLRICTRFGDVHDRSVSFSGYPLLTLRRPSTAAYGSTAQDIPSATSSRLPFTSRFHSLTIASMHRRQDGGSTTPMLKVGDSGRMGWMTWGWGSGRALTPRRCPLVHGRQCSAGNH
jgi:hypothetical protein